jgi:succinate-semialdehyde dehydrogenase/glutarate-semialdehyde dehydrogenase
MTADTSGASALFDATRLSPDRLAGLADRAGAEDADSGESITVRAPATDNPIGTVPDSQAEDVAKSVERARAAQADWATTPVADRAAVIERVGDLVLARRDRLLDLLQLETGKARSDGLEEFLDVTLACSYYASRGPSMLADESRTPAVPGATAARVTYDPVGVVGAISPWNYPVTLAVAEAIPAIMAGNAVVLKPDEKTPYVALAIAELFENAGLPAGVFEVVTGQADVIGQALVDRVDHVAFTGSTETGRLVAERAGRNLVECSLELGGNNPLLVLDDADPKTAARGVVTGAFANAGQLCLAPERIYVHESVQNAFFDELVGATRRLTLGTDFDYGADVGSLIDADQLNRVERHVESAVADGASVLCGGRHRPDLGPFVYEPTVLTDVAPDAPVACEETFGPVVTVTPVPDTGAAVAAANDSPYGLNASVWTGDRERGRTVARAVDCGTVCVNDAYAAGWAAVDAPMGGIGDSGIGRRHGPEGLRRFLEPKTIATSRIGPLDPPPWVPNGLAARGFVLLTRLQRRIETWVR